MGKFRSGLVYRYPAHRSLTEGVSDGLPNYFFETALPGAALPLLEKGINQIARNQKTANTAYPAILIASSPQSRGTEWNPWHDTFEPDLGYVRYFGDAKKPGNPALAPGNKVLLEELAKHTSGDRETRSIASPFIFFERVSVDGRPYGNIKFQGYGVLEKAELVTQYNPGIGYFTNYVFTFAVLSLAAEDETLDWDWVNDRRRHQSSPENSSDLAPASWKTWQKSGRERIEAIRRRAALSKVESTDNQRPKQGSREEKCLNDVYRFYSAAGKHRFELLASRVVMSHINTNGGSYAEGWVTRGSGDGGVDFVGKIRLGSGFSSMDVVVLGQAKCEAPDKPTNGVALARTVARLKRGWIGAYVTTSYFSRQSQLEVIEDAYPLIKVSGKTLAEETLKLVEAGGFRSTLDFLEVLELEYPERIQNRRPDEILDL